MAHCCAVYCTILSACGAVFLVTDRQLMLAVLAWTDYEFLPIQEHSGLPSFTAAVIYGAVGGVCWYRGLRGQESLGQYRPVPQQPEEERGVQLQVFSESPEEI